VAAKSVEAEMSKQSEILEQKISAALADDNVGSEALAELIENA
jgi:hypothetical protein